MAAIRVTRSGPTAALFVAVVGAAAAQNPIRRVSVDSNGAESNGMSGNFHRPAVSGDGRFAAFESYADNLVAGDTNVFTDVFVHDLVTGATVRMSVDSSGVEGNKASWEPAISADGRFVAFSSEATNLVAADTNGFWDVFVRDRDTDGNGTFDEGNGVTIRVSVASDGTQGDANAFSPCISPDGAVVAFASWATNLVSGDTNAAPDVFVRDLAAGTTFRVSVSTSGAEGNRWSNSPAISGDGSIVAFVSSATNLVANDSNRYRDIFVHDRSSGVTTLVSVDSSGAQADFLSEKPAISSDGGVVAFWSRADNLVPNDTNHYADIFVRDRAAGTTTRVSVDSAGTEGNQASDWPSISADGNRISFSSASDNLVPGDPNFGHDVFVHDRATGATRLGDSSCGVFGDGVAILSAISGDGSALAFSGFSTDLVFGDANGWPDVFVNLGPDPDATWSNYGIGWAGTLGVPTLTASADPVLGTGVAVDVGNSLGSWTPGFLLVGASSASIPTHFGGTLLVDFAVIETVVVSPGGSSVPFTIPGIPMFAGLHAFFQAIELDPGASDGWSFSPGLELVLGG